MADYITPKNWSNMFDVGAKSTEADAFFQRNFITFTAYEPPTINYAATSTRNSSTPSSKKLMSYSFYYPRNSIREDVSNIYSENSGALATLISEGKEIVREAVVGVKFLKAGATGGAKGSGILVDEPTYFTHTEKRKFSIILNLYSTSNSQEDIYRPIFFFKKYSLASGESYNMGGLGITTINFPSTFTITGGMFSNPTVMPRTDNGLPYHLVLKNISVEYNSEIQLLDSEGNPLQATLNLDFEELKTLFQGDYPGDINNTNLIKTKITTTGGKT